MSDGKSTMAKRKTASAVSVATKSKTPATAAATRTITSKRTANAVSRAPDASKARANRQTVKTAVRKRVKIT